MFGKYDDNGKLIPALMNFVKWEIPRRVYTQSHIDYIVEVFEELLVNKDNARGITITKEPEWLRHFKAHFEQE
jgi:tryptophanase